MRKSSLAIGLLVVSLLLSAWSNVIAAAFCPRYSSSHNCDLQRRQVKQVEHKSPCQHEMAEMEMRDMQMNDMDMESETGSETSDKSIAENVPIQIAAESPAEQVAVDLPNEPCGHCWMHSQPQSPSSTVVAIDPSKQLVEANAPPVGFVTLLPSAFAVSLIPLEHGPPGPSLPRHILINSFRI